MRGATVAPYHFSYRIALLMKFYLPKATVLKPSHSRSDVECLGIICAGLTLACLLLGLRIISIW
jgi:hypothetical protein